MEVAVTAAEMAAEMELVEPAAEMATAAATAALEVRGTAAACRTFLRTGSCGQRLCSS